MFVLSQSDNYKWPVTVELPGDGRPVKQNFDAVFKRLSQSEIEKLVASVSDDDTGAYVTIARQILVGWKGVTDATGAELPYSETVRDQLLDIAGMAATVVQAFFASVAGGKRKN